MSNDMIACLSVTQMAEAGRRFRALARAAPPPGERPPLLLQTIVTKDTDEDLQEDELVQMLAPAWFRVMVEWKRMPHLLDDAHWQTMQRLIAVTYAKDRWETSLVRSGLLLSRRGLGSVQFIDGFSAHPSDRLIGATEIRPLLSLLPSMPAGSIGVVSSTGDFAPELPEAAAVRSFLPDRLRLRNRGDLMTWLKSMAARIEDAYNDCH
jgi:hypothetical protein